MVPRAGCGWAGGWRLAVVARSWSPRVGRNRSRSGAKPRRYSEPRDRPDDAVPGRCCVTRYPVKSMGGEPLATVAGRARPVCVGDREWAVYGADGKLASGKHSRRFRRMDPVFDLVAAQARRGHGGDAAGRVGGRRSDSTDADAILSAHFGEPVTLRRETDVMHQDAATFSLVGSATLAELGRHEGDGRPLDPRHLRANVVVADRAAVCRGGLGRARRHHRRGAAAGQRADRAVPDGGGRPGRACPRARACSRRSATTTTSTPASTRRSLQPGTISVGDVVASTDR